MTRYEKGFAGLASVAAELASAVRDSDAPQDTQSVLTFHATLEEARRVLGATVDALGATGGTRRATGARRNEAGRGGGSVLMLHQRYSYARRVRPCVRSPCSAAPSGACRCDGYRERA